MAKINTFVTPKGNDFFSDNTKLNYILSKGSIRTGKGKELFEYGENNVIIVFTPYDNKGKLVVSVHKYNIVYDLFNILINLKNGKN